MTEAKWVYEHNSDNSARYILGQPQGRVLACIGINSSTAVPDDLDPTLKNVKKFSQIHGYDGWLMFNVYPQRSTDPNGMHDELDECEHKMNLKYIKQYLKKYDNVDIWAAWGTIIEKRSYLKEALTDIVDVINGFDVNWVTIGKLSVKGHPHHPLYLSHKTGISEFDVEQYIGTRQKF
ncbi:MAG: DUF1643 domain-containing protein [Phycisphaerae bacterium]|nr:DUF1643 domain-containing protein [Phycisphaerae bacterium]